MRLLLAPPSYLTSLLAPHPLAKQKLQKLLKTEVPGSNPPNPHQGMNKTKLVWQLLCLEEKSTFGGKESLRRTFGELPALCPCPTSTSSSGMGSCNFWTFLHCILGGFQSRGIGTSYSSAVSWVAVSANLSWQGSIMSESWHRSPLHCSQRQGRYRKCTYSSH